MSEPDGVFSIGKRASVTMLSLTVGISVVMRSLLYNFWNLQWKFGADLLFLALCSISKNTENIVKASRKSAQPVFLVVAIFFCLFSKQRAT